MKKQLLAAATFAALLAMPLASQAADAGDWSVRVAGDSIHWANQSDAFSALSLNFPSGAVQLADKIIPEFDINYTVTPNIVAQLVLTYPQTATVNLGGPAAGANLGTFKFLPPSLVAQYHFLPGQSLDPYVGAGVNFTWVTSVHLSVAGNALDLKKSSFGLVANVGADYNVDKKWFVNADLKYINPLQSDVSVGGTKLTTAKLNPTLFSLGVGYHF